jgi:hypothetical protein
MWLRTLQTKLLIASLFLLSAFSCLEHSEQNNQRKMKLSQLFLKNKLVAQYRYDPSGRIIESAYISYYPDTAKGDRTSFTYEYDAQGKISKAISGDEDSKTEYNYYYNNRNQLESMKGRTGLEIYYQYDAGGRMKEEDVHITNSFTTLRLVYRYTWDAKNYVIGIYAEKQTNYILQSRAEYKLTYGTLPNPQPAIPGRSLQNFLNMPGFWYSTNNVTKVDYHNMTHEVNEVTTIKYDKNAANYPVRAAITSANSDFNGKVYSFQYE